MSTRLKLLFRLVLLADGKNKLEDMLSNMDDILLRNYNMKDNKKKMKVKVSSKNV